ncbi:MAG: alpha/beta hydrolase family protein, partial [Phycisphaeraceae bacterium JB051]
MKFWTLGMMFVLLLLCQSVHAGKLTWDQTLLQHTPVMSAASEHDQGDIKAIFFDGPTWHGKTTRVFAYLGLPKVPAGQKVPGMVLVHGGGGTAFHQWVKIWNDRGYAAIALDTTGCINADGKGKRQRHPQGGPDGWGSFTQMQIGGDSLVDEDLWTYQAVAQIMLAHSLLRSLPEVDATRTGLTGISWGGYLTCIAGSQDHRFKIAMPVYGCGFMYESPNYRALLEKKSTIKERWIRTCDPSLYLPDATADFLWVTGTNDHHFALDTFDQSRELVTSPQAAVVRLNMTHSHKAGWQPEELYAFADQKLKQANTTLIRGIEQTHDSKQILVSFRQKNACEKAQLLYTTSTNPVWRERPWEAIDISVDNAQQRVVAPLPEHTAACYVNLISQGGLITSTPLVMLRDSQPLKPLAQDGVDDFENRSVGDGVSGCVIAPGMSIKVTDEAAYNGRQSLVFTDTQSNRGWLPMRQQWFKSSDQIDQGNVRLSFALMQKPNHTGRFYVQLRDYNGTNFVNGLSVEINDQGEVSVNGKRTLPVNPGQWVYFDVLISLPDGSVECEQTTEQGTETYNFQTKGFSKINWLGFVSAGNASAQTYLDKVSFKVTQAGDAQQATSQLPPVQPKISLKTSQAINEIEDYESFAVGQTVKYAQVAPGTAIQVTNAFAKTGQQALAFTDAKTNQSWLPMLSRWFKGDQTITRGKLQMQFDLMQ